MKLIICVIYLSALFSPCAVAGPIVDASVASGKLRGVVNGSVTSFLGIPYATPPVGDNRWRAPRPVAPWSGVRAANHFSPACFQKVTPRIPSVSEDCLYLNVWTPAQSEDARLPVLFWIYGGAYQEGAGSEPVLDGEQLAKKGIIVVNFNFRMGALGFMAHPDLTAEAPYHSSGNYGMLDVVAALKWVRANIAAFGGDPNAITVGGQSSGAGQVSIVDVSPLTRGLYARAIIQSGPRIGGAGASFREAEAQGQEFAKGLGARSLPELRALPAEKILQASQDMPSFRFASTFDHYVQPLAPIDEIKRGQFNKVPVLVGYTYDEQTYRNPKADNMSAGECAAYIDKEAGIWAPKFRDAYVSAASPDCFDDIRALSRDRHLLTAFDWATIRLSKSTQPVVTYVFNHAPPGPNAARDRSYHGAEVSYEFGTLDKVPDRPFTQTDRDISDRMSAYWVNFVKSGNPNGAGLPEWPRVNPNVPEVMVLGDEFAPRPVIASEKRRELMQHYLVTQGPNTLSEGPLAFSR